jgi:hypothetical protein
VDLNASDAPIALDVIRQQELPMVLLFNRGRVMAMTQGVSKVAPFIHALAATRVLPAVPRARRRLHFGFTPDGHGFPLAVRGRNILVAGDAKSGKSWAAGLLCEQLILHGYSIPRGAARCHSHRRVSTPERSRYDLTADESPRDQAA